MSHVSAIKVINVSKQFVLPHEKKQSIKKVVTSLFNKTGTSTTQKALNNIDLDIKEGEFFGIVGRNGSGKSTLLKIIAGIYQPSQGKIEVNGKIVPFIELGVGFNPELTGRENVFLNGAILGFDSKYVQSKYKEIVDFAELDDFMDQKLKNYSSGMQVRLAFSCSTILAQSDILLIDEVLAVGDADFQRKCFNFFKKLKREKKTIVFVSHDMNAVREYCDRAVLIEKSKIIKQGKVAEVASAYTKMFIKNENGDDSSLSNKLDRKRWGNGKLKYEAIKISPPNATEKDSEITVSCRLSAQEDVKDPVIGFTVKNSAGTNMLGTNSKLLNHEVGLLKAGETYTITWSFINILNDGDYSVDVAAINNQTLDEYDWWEDSTDFSVYRDVHTDYVVEPKVNLEVER